MNQLQTITYYLRAAFAYFFMAGALAAMFSHMGAGDKTSSPLLTDFFSFVMAGIIGSTVMTMTLYLIRRAETQKDLHPQFAKFGVPILLVAMWLSFIVIMVFLRFAQPWSEM